VSRDPGRLHEDDRRAGLVEMYRAAIAYLDTLDDPAVGPLRRELADLQRRLVDEQRHAGPDIAARP
jgi:hypothetical protein